MDSKQKFQNFLESLKGKEQDNLIESVKKGFQVCFEGYNVKFENGEGNIPIGKISELTLEQKESLGDEAIKLVNKHNARVKSINQDIRKIFYIELSGWGEIRYTLWISVKGVGLRYIQTLSEEPLRAVQKVIKLGGDDTLINFTNKISNKGNRMETKSGIMPVWRYKKMPWKDVLYQDFVHIYRFVKWGKKKPEVTIHNLANEIENSVEYNEELTKPENKEKIAVYEKTLAEKRAEIDSLVELFKSKNYKILDPEFSQKLYEFEEKYNTGMPNKIFNLNKLSLIPIGKYENKSWRDLINEDFNYIQWFLKEGSNSSELASTIANQIRNSPEYTEKLNSPSKPISSDSNIRKGTEVNGNATYEGRSANGNIKFMINGKRLIVKPMQLPPNFDQSQLNVNDSVNVSGVVSWISNDGKAFMVNNIKI